jgi:segregation and condensation protein B
LAAAPDDQGISLDELSRAYAALIGKGDDPYQQPPMPDSSGAELVVDRTDATAEDTACELCPKSIVEAILFVGHPRNEPISSEQLAELMRGVSAWEIDDIVAELNVEYQQYQHPYRVVTQGAGYRLELCEEFAPLRRVFYGRVREARLSQAAIDVLAIVAYRQGCTRQEIEQTRGRPSGSILTHLVRRHLLRIERPQQKPRTPRYHVTGRFLELFALSSIDELPQSQDLD